MDTGEDEAASDRDTGDVESDHDSADGIEPQPYNTDVYEHRYLANWMNETELPSVISEQVKMTLLRELRIDGLRDITHLKGENHDKKYDLLPSEDWAHLQRKIVCCSYCTHVDVPSVFLCSDAARKANAGVPTFHGSQLIARFKYAEWIFQRMTIDAEKQSSVAAALRDQIMKLKQELANVEQRRKILVTHANRTKAVTESLHKLMFIYRTRVVPELPPIDDLD
jgi:hypothetical protein